MTNSIIGGMTSRDKKGRSKRPWSIRSGAGSTGQFAMQRAELLRELVRRLEMDHRRRLLM